MRRVLVLLLALVPIACDSRPAPKHLPRAGVDAAATPGQVAPLADDEVEPAPAAEECLAMLSLDEVRRACDSPELVEAPPRVGATAFLAECARRFSGPQSEVLTVVVMTPEEGALEADSKLPDEAIIAGLGDSANFYSQERGDQIWYTLRARSGKRLVVVRHIVPRSGEQRSCDRDEMEAVMRKVLPRLPTE